MYKPFDLTGKVALITGGNGGIGLGMAHGLAQAGAGIAIWGTNPEKNAQSLAQLKAHGRPVSARVVNVADEAAVVRAMEETVAEMGRVDCCIANAGIGSAAASFLDITAEKYRKVLAVNEDGVFFTLREAARHMVERGKRGDTAGGSLVGVASLAAIEGAARNQHYAATKGAVISMIKGIAVEFARYGVRANAILPGWIATDMTAGAQASPAFTDKVIPRIPARRWGEPDDFSGIAVYLASDASRYHSGDTFVIDGGYAIF
ncbi:MAG TPA: 2-deoxy-D-gluconate 3-dehydrogenase [Alphaproteobacteria bacterium]|nr:2-deoxy-D-gluconate 3-dehydrogenase [Alphaproteobacteria bacterium]HAJ46322.1 2-deoxy-D-gluconate 3-dehydrogenase [Alphaproteobacteria bacterium]